eukprot:CAMPEP_0203685734 /NCGR_PEP_ID=MMETSP0090-20130426/48697_1 /ASSEMBLY_ACC=CAM_ASM_001088 /TAXON_ID=426623 /ORGANISM="Chaetoceros affinis, Strain CCMP159" /LENGTH=364 /DNA_ID=CAMNT_0050554939 /DNA_START=751 /DNA_END=1841 /DNA_ORIENTATION=-
MALAHHFATKGTFLSLMNDKSFMDQYSLHVAWFCVDSNSRKRILADVNFHDGISQDDKGENRGDQKKRKTSSDLLNTLRDVYEERNFISFICNLLSLIKRKLTIGFPPERGSPAQKDYVDEVQAYLVRSDRYIILLEHTFEFIRKASKKELVELFGIFSERSNAHLSRHNRILEVSGVCREKDDGSSYSRRMMMAQSFFNESIVLIENATDDINWDLREWLVEEICTILWRQPFHGENRMPLSSIVCFGNHERVLSYISSVYTKPRRDLASAIADPTFGRGVHDMCASDVRLAFIAFDSRVIAVDEWFRRFIDSLPSSDKDKRNAATDNLMQRFAFCLYQLVFCGLIIRSTRRKGNIFEKSALV